MECEPLLTTNHHGSRPYQRLDGSMYSLADVREQNWSVRLSKGKSRDICDKYGSAIANITRLMHF